MDDEADLDLRKPRSGTGAAPTPSNVANQGHVMDEPRATPVTGWRRVLYLVAAGFFFLLGALGAALPGLPATPFLLLTSYLLVRSHPQLNERLLRSRLLGPVLTDWQEKGGIRSNVKWKAISVVLVVVTLTLLFAEGPLWLSATIAALAVVGITVIIRLPTIPPQDDD